MVWFVKCRIAEWVNTQAEREREAAQRKQEKLERLKQGPAHTFDDSTYTKQIQGNAEMIHSALQQGKCINQDRLN